MVEERVHTLDGLRLITLMGIACLHAQLNFIGGAYQVTSFFFVIAGFFFDSSKYTYGQYLRHILSRIFLPYWFCLAIWLCVFQRIDWNIIPHIFLLHSWVPVTYAGTAFTYNYMSGSWFLSSLLFCYLCSYLIDKLFNKIDSRLLGFGLLLILFAITRILPHKTYGYWLIYICPLLRLCEFSLGMILRRNIGEVRKIKMGGVFAVFLLLFLYLSCLHWHLPQHVCTILHLGMIYTLFKFRSPIMDVCLGNKIIQFLSGYFIFIYLIHEEVLKFMNGMDFCIYGKLGLAVGISIVIGCFYKLSMTLLKIIIAKNSDNTDIEIKD